MAYESAKKIVDEGLESMNRYYSVYRGIVIDPEDPLHQNRIKVCVPEVNGGMINWAYPRGQHGSNGDGFKYFTPKMGDIVFVTFEYGDHTKPLWEFHGWALKQIPSELDGVNKCGIVTPEGNMIILDDNDGSLSLRFTGDITVVSEGNVTIDAQRILNLSSEQSIVLNEGDNQGLVNIRELTEKLNNLVSQLEQLRSLFNSHVHSGVTTGPGSSGPTATPASTPFSEFNQLDYEDLNIIH